MNELNNKEYLGDECLDNFRRLFDDAKEKDELEYCCALLRIEGTKGPGWDTLVESSKLLQQIMNFVCAPIDSDFKVRLILMAYCHTIEMDFIYNIIGNMINISKGERYSINCFSKFKNNKKCIIYPVDKIKKILEWTKGTSYEPIGNVFQQIHQREIRNAFDHSDYVIYRDNFHIKSTSKSYPLKVLLPILTLGINTGLLLIQKVLKRIQSYKESKIIFLSSNHPLGSPYHVGVRLLVEPNYGLIGFEGVVKR